MCGIGGHISWEAPLATAGVDAMLEALGHRGPDGEGVHLERGAILLHRRLAILDRTGGAQPLSDERGKLWLAFNGEVYNYKELRTLLESKGRRFRTRTDSEVILAALQVWGEEALGRLRGMFALALWDGERRRLLLARDRFGQKPLYFVEEAKELLFASEPGALLAVRPDLRGLNLQALDQYLTLRFTIPPETWFPRIQELPPGHLAVWEGGRKLRWESYWSPSFGPKWKGSAGALKEELRERLTVSLALHLRSDVAVGAFLSGGLDSSLMMALLRQQGLVPRGFPTFSLRVPYAGHEESPLARALARQMGLCHREEELDRDFWRHIPRLVQAMGEPSDPLALCLAQVSRLAAGHVKCVLGGDGGDELLGGYDRYLGHLWLQIFARVPGLPSLVRRLPEGEPAAGWYRSWEHRLGWARRLLGTPAGERYARSLAYFYWDEQARRRLYAPPLRRALDLGQALRPLVQAFQEGEGDLLDRMQRVDLLYRLPNHSLRILDRTSMAVGLETRSPYLDPSLVDFATRLPSRLKVGGHRTRVLQRKLASDYLPREIAQRSKQGFSSALPYLWRGAREHLYRSFLKPSRLAGEGLLRQEEVDRLAVELQGGRDHNLRLWLLLSAEIWFRIFVLGFSADELARKLSGSQKNRELLHV